MSRSVWRDWRWQANPDQSIALEPDSVLMLPKKAVAMVFCDTVALDSSSLRFRLS
jgi:hypothetical protein